MTRMKVATAVLSAAVVAAALATVTLAQPAARFDLLIRNGRVLDGTGNPWFPADIAVQNGRIVAIGSLANAQAAREIDAAGKYVAPGFIDIHSHADDGSSPRGGLRDSDPIRRSAPNLVSRLKSQRHGTDRSTGESPVTYFRQRLYRFEMLSSESRIVPFSTDVAKR